MDINDQISRYASGVFGKVEEARSKFEQELFLMRLEAIERALERALSEIQSLKHDAHGKMQFGLQSICGIKGDYVHSAVTATAMGSQDLFTAGGSAKGIREKIREVLAIRKEPMTSAQLAEAIYVYDPRVSFDLFKRRVIVAASAMHKEENPPRLIPSDRKSTGREVHWALPEWIEEFTPAQMSA